ncbi:MBL fold metallo-hydrolase [Ectobacillus ponti]|uniref:MBL fold metallo-hydrolase n=1 Tax=Ectobacillus ponti TaxID=2961894 RepID=A0AA41X8P7_9BACI|nr:MBL fold metallo-hydrolase [Ectobacillus ponti]MCP8968930.1 MBL fold metallo-hydrolase [Ectobacillus ponti]
MGERLYIIDDYDLGEPERTGTYVLLEEKVTIVETCASPSLPYILKGLGELGVSLSDVAYIIVTHVHLDHAGGAGLLMEKCPNAKLIVHPRGARHLIDPVKLIQGARAVYGEQFDRLFDPIVPIPEERVMTVQDGETLQISDARTLTFYHTPGHALHHIGIHDSLTNGIFTGDTIGIFYQGLGDFELYLPSTSPTQFQPDAMLASLERIRSLHVDRIYFGHYGMSVNVQEVYRQVAAWLPQFLEMGQSVFAAQTDFPAASAELAKVMLARVHEFLSENGAEVSESAQNVLRLDMEVSAMGLIDYLVKQAQAEKA